MLSATGPCSQMLSAASDVSFTCSQRAAGDFPKSLQWAPFVSPSIIKEISASETHSTGCGSVLFPMSGGNTWLFTPLSLNVLSYL